jgi:hypothetical protein
MTISRWTDQSPEFDDDEENERCNCTHVGVIFVESEERVNESTRVGTKVNWYKVTLDGVSNFICVDPMDGPKHKCKDCGTGHCEHGRQRGRCKDCGTGYCQHGRPKHTRKDCGTGHCEHGRQRGWCKDS